MFFTISSLNEQKRFFVPLKRLDKTERNDVSRFTNKIKKLDVLFFVFTVFYSTRG